MNDTQLIINADLADLGRYADLCAVLKDFTWKRFNLVIQRSHSEWEVTNFDDVDEYFPTYTQAISWIFEHGELRVRVGE